MNEQQPTIDMEKEVFLKNIAVKLKETELFGNNTELGYKSEKQMIFLAAAGVKPVAEVVSGHWVETSEGRKSAPDDPDKVRDFLDEINLKSHVTSDEHATDGLVSLEGENIEKFLSLSGTEDEYDIGLLFGFPESAVEAFKNGETLSDEEQEKVIADYLEPGMREFLEFRLSKNNWQEELETAKKWYETLKKYDMLDF